MQALHLINNISSLATVATGGAPAKSGAAMSDIGEIRDGAILFDSKIRWVGTAREAQHKLETGEIDPATVIDASGKTVLPGFVDSHTHLVFAGDRSDEFARRARGVDYRTIAAEGGGILKTMRAVRESSPEELMANAMPLLTNAISHGSTAIEIKSGYGLTTASELNQLRAIRMLKEEFPITISATFLGAHDFPPEYKERREDYLQVICNEMIPTVAAEGLAEYCDVFTDVGYYTVEETERIFACARQHGLKLRIHADEFGDVSAAAMAARCGCVSADHLLQISDEGMAAMREAGVVATLLPGTAYFLALPYAPARRIIDAGLVVALASDCNPGSCFSENMQLILSMACTQMKMSIEEAIAAATINGAAALQLSETMGSLEVGKSANFAIAACSSYKDIVYHFGVNHISEVWVDGRRLMQN